MTTYGYEIKPRAGPSWAAAGSCGCCATARSWAAADPTWSRSKDETDLTR